MSNRGAVLTVGFSVCPWALCSAVMCAHRLLDSMLSQRVLPCSGRNGALEFRPGTEDSREETCWFSIFPAVASSGTVWEFSSVETFQLCDYCPLAKSLLSRPGLPPQPLRFWLKSPLRSGSDWMNSLPV